MKYYITADIHGFYTELHKALDEAGYFTDPEPHKLIILDNLFDLGLEALVMQPFIFRLMEPDDRVLCQASFDDLYKKRFLIDEGLAVWRHRIWVIRELCVSVIPRENIYGRLDNKEKKA